MIGQGQADITSDLLRLDPRSRSQTGDWPQMDADGVVRLFLICVHLLSSPPNSPNR